MPRPADTALMARTSFTHWNVARLPRSVKTLEVAMQSTGGLELNNATITSDVTNSGTIGPNGIVLSHGSTITGAIGPDRAA
jgi:hypothetical protein